MECEICGRCIYGHVCDWCTQKALKFDAMFEALESLALPPYSDSDLESFIKMQNAVAQKAVKDAKFWGN